MFNELVAGGLVLKLHRSIGGRDPGIAATLLNPTQPFEETFRSRDEFREWAVDATEFDLDVKWVRGYIPEELQLEEKETKLFKNHDRDQKL